MRYDGFLLIFGKLFVMPQIKMSVSKSEANLCNFYLHMQRVIINFGEELGILHHLTIYYLINKES